MKLAFTLGYRLLKNNKKRTFAIIMAASLVAAMITAVWIFATSAQKVFQEMNKLNPNNMQYNVQFQNIPDSKLPVIEGHQLVRTAAVEKNVGYASFKQSENEYKKYLYVKSVQSETFEEAPFVLSEGKWPKNSKEIVLPLHLKTNGMVNVAVGDKLTLKVGTRINKDTKEILDQSDPMYDESLEGDENKKGLINEGVVDTTTMTFTVTGFIKRPSYTVELTQAPGYTVITTGLKTGAYSAGSSNVSVVYKDPGKAAQSTKTIAESLGYSTEELPKEGQNSGYYTLDEKNGVTVQYNLTEQELIYNGASYNYYEGLGFVTVMAVVLTVVLVLFSVSAIYNTFNVCLQAQLQEFALLRSIGTTYRQIKHIIYCEGILLGGIVAVIGSLIGFMGTWVTMKFMSPYVQNVLQESITLEYTVSFTTVFIALAVIFVTVFLSVYFQAAKVKKKQILEVLFDKGIQVKNANIKSSGWVQKKLGFEAALAYKNMSRNRKVYLANFTSLITSVLLIFAFAIFFTQSGILSPSNKMEPYDVVLNVSADQINREIYFRKKPEEQERGYSGNTIKQYTAKEYLDIMDSYGLHLRESENITSVVSVYGTFEFDKTGHISEYNDNYEVSGEETITPLLQNVNDEEIEGKKREIDYTGKVYIQVVSDDTMESLFGDDEAYSVDPNTIPVGVMYNAYGGIARPIEGLRKGDVLTIDTGNNQSVKLFVGRQGTTKQDLNLRLNTVNVFMSEEYFNTIAKSNPAFALTPGDNSFYIRTFRHARALEDITQIFRTPTSGQLIVTDNSAEKNRDFAQKVLVYTFSVGLLSLVLLIALTNVYNTIHVNLTNRRQEFSVLKSVGLTNKSLSKMLMFECSFYVLQTLFSAFLVLFVANSFAFALLGTGPLQFMPRWHVVAAVTLLLFFVLFLAMRYFARGLYKRDFITDLKKINS